MKWERISTVAGMTLLGGAFLFSAIRLVTLKLPAVSQDRTPILRFAHVTIHPGIINAYDEAMRDYERLHPGIKLEQVPVPLRLWSSWLRTQMVGGTAPDLVDMDRGQEDDFLARYLIPLDSWLAQPNPYNKGTDLEHVPWRDTFVDGISHEPGYRPNLRQVYGIPLTLGTMRVFANARLYEEITGGLQPPADYADFVKLCDRIREYAERTGRPLDPLAGSNTHSLPLLNRMYSSQTQKLAIEALDVPNLAPNMRDGAIAYLRGKWNWNSPEALSGIRLMKEVGNNMVPGFAQLQRDDSLLHFTQGNAVLLASGSWEADTVMSQCSFPLISFPIPIPLPTDERYGAYTLGPISELAIPPGNAVGVSRNSRYPEQAVNFLQYLTSQPVAQRVMQASKRLSCIVGVAPSSEMEVFRPMEYGYPPGFPVEFTEGFFDAIRIYRTRLYSLFGPNGSPEKFASAMERDFSPALRKDLAKIAKESVKISRAEDVTFLDVESKPRKEDLELLSESQTIRELEAQQIRFLLKTSNR
jgi:raffinose/stachyose/melibiose transport system substrate-binding protein